MVPARTLSTGGSISTDGGGVPVLTGDFERDAANVVWRADEARLRALATATTSAIWTIDASGDLLDAPSARWPLLTDLPEEEIAREWLAAVHPDDRAPGNAIWWAGIAAGEPFSFEQRVRQRDGSFRHFAVRAVPVRGDDGMVREWIGADIDVTERRAAEEQLRASEHQLRAMADAMPQVVWIADRDGTVRYYNSRVSQFAGVTRSDAGTWDWRPVIHPDDLHATTAAWQHAMRDRSLYTHEHRIQMAGGGYRWHLSRAVPIIDTGGEVATWYGTATDVHDLKAAEVARRENEDRLRLGIEVAGLALSEIDYDAGVIHLSAEAARLYGLGEQAVTLPRELVHATFHPDDRDELLRRIGVPSVSANGDAYTSEYRIVRPDGAERWLSVRKRVIFDDSDVVPRPKRAILAALDITERRLADDALQHQSEITRTITENATLALFLMDDRQRCTFMNPAAEAMTGFTLAEVRDAPLHDFVHHTRPDGTPYPLAECPIDRALPERALTRGEEVFVHKDGHFYPVAFTASPILRDGIPVGTVIEVEDISERKRAETNRQTLLDALAHDLRNPLTTIKMESELLQRRIAQRGVPDSVDLTGRLANLEALADRMTLLLDELDDLAHLTSDAASPLDRQPVDLVALVHERIAAGRSGGLATIEFETGESELIGHWHEIQVGRVIENLLSNAVKYSPPGSPIRIRVIRDGANAVLQIEDQGIGIPAADLSRIFTFRHRGGNVGAIPGGGAGLTSIKQIVEGHGGSIAFTSEEGVGSVFAVRLPLRQRETPDRGGKAPAHRPGEPLR